MSITLSSASLPVFRTALTNLHHLLDKARADAAARGYDPQVLVAYRLAPDMLPFKSQVFIACDAAKLCAARLGGLEAPKFDDTENTLEELQGRIQKTLDWLATVPASAIDGQEAREITFPVGKAGTRTMLGEDYLKGWALPNVFFHVTTAYVILRHNGVPLGKRDYLVGSAA
ncbi:DUF1993 domain-containing protein [Methyloversatilis sp.]|uniref:DUF1993 domain-containing protein n=1 Tax=Methyloversatilis sp. TaxID=2569862 RepID=UPI002735440F|nr:DUF1993 domain-containing protein [Methyloversatilis sp.]MDP3578919.1 DUF1993 domain-containing protein [Methyloversatilis sp.]